MEYQESYNDKLRALLGKEVRGVIDRPLGSHHPKHSNIIYEVNYGYINDFIAPDGEEQDVYLIGVDKPVDTFKGIVIAIIHRLDDNEDKLVVSINGKSYSNEEIEKLLHFQEQYFKHTIIRG